MKDIERLLAEAMRAEGEKIDPDTYSARRKFLERRRKKRIRFAFSGVAVAGAAVAAAVFVASSVPDPVIDDDLELASAIPKVIATAPVSGAPQAAAVVSDGVWVTNAEPGRVSKIDAATGDLVTSVDLAPLADGEPDEIVAVGSNIFITTTGGGVVVLEAGTGDVFLPETAEISLDRDEPTAAARPSDIYRADLDVSGDTVWVANENNGSIHAFFNAGSDGKDSVDLPLEGLAPNDIAVGDGLVFGYDSIRGLVAVFDITGEPGPPKLEPRDEILTVPSGNYMDMRYGFGKLWISDESGNVFAFDPDSGEELSVTDVGGRYTDLVVDGDSVWALPGGDEDGGRLVAIDPEDGTLRNEGLDLAGNPVDVAAGLGSLWVVDKDGGSAQGAGAALLRVDPTGVGTPAPEPEATGDVVEDEVAGAEPFFAYSAGGDIYLEMTDGTSQQITMSADEEFNPVFAFGSLIFERHDHETDNFGLITHDLATGEEQMILLDGEWKGTHPAVSAGGDLAWAEVDDDGPSVHVWPGYSSGEPESESFEIELPAAELGDPRALNFSDDAKSLYLQAFGEGWVTVQVSLYEQDGPNLFVLNGITDQRPGSTFVQPEDPDSDGITVLDVCCRETDGDPYSQFEIARIAFNEGGATYKDVMTPADLADADPGALTMVSLHGATLAADGSWDLFAEEEGSWLVSDGNDVWVLTADGGGQVAPETLESGELDGFSVNPYLEGDL